MPTIAALRAQDEQRLHNFVDEEFADVRCFAIMADGDPAMVICRISERQRTDIIMMPTKGLGTFRRFLVGSITAKVLHDASCGVFTSAHACDSSLELHTQYSAIVCAVELNNEAERIVRAAASFAKIWAASVLVIHMAHRQHFIVPSDHVTEHQLSAFLERIGVSAEGRILDAGVADGIRRSVIEKPADLVIVGRGHDRGKISCLWSDLYEIVRESPCPVLSF
jgi:hypothetical protein